MTLRFSPARGAGALSLSAYLRGPTGAAATIAIGTNTALAEGSTPTVSNSGSISAATFNFGIPRGVIPAIGFNFSTTTTDSDPGSGNIRFNNPTVSSVTTMYFDNVDRDGNTVTGWLDSFDDSTNTAKGTLIITPAASPTAKLIYSVSGSVVDGTGYRKVTVAWVSGTTLPSDIAQLAFAFFRAGDVATGDVVGPSSSVDNEIALFSGTGGKTIKRASTTGLLKGASGVISAATAGTDYYNPGGTDVAVADGGTGASTASAARDNLGLGTANSPQFTGIEVGNASDTTLTRSAAGVIAVEGVPLYSNIPQNSKSAAYTTVLADANEHILHPAADNNARTFTIDSNANVPYIIGTTITFVNEINTVTIAITSDTLTFAGAGTTGSRTLAANGVATALKITATKWMISGTGLT